jgi:DNA-binding beta-propeller fold protein YncE
MRTRMYVMAVLFAVSPLFAACSAPSYTRVLWPKPPLEPKLEFVGVYGSTADFDYTRYEQFMFDFFGDRTALFKMPCGITANSRGDVFVSDQEGIKVVNPGRKTVKKIASVALVGQPLGITIDGSGRLYVPDNKTKTVFVLNGDGGLLGTIGGPQVFGKPAHVAVNERLGMIYVSDSARHRISVFTMEGALLFSFGKAGKGNGEFAFPQGLAVAPDNTLFVADMLNGRIQVFSAQGVFLRAFGQAGINYWEFEAPRDLAFGPDGNLYLVDFRKALLSTYTPEGKLLFITGDLKKRTSHPLGLSSPASIYITKEGALYIADLLNHRIARWQILTPDYLRNHPLDAP